MRTKLTEDRPDTLYNLLYIHAVNNCERRENNAGFRLCKYNQVYPNSFSRLVTEEWQALIEQPWQKLIEKD